MSTRSNRLGWLVVAGALGAAANQLCAAPLDSLRVAGIDPSVFDYRLTGISRSTDGTACLSFNDRVGNTWFRHPGEHLGVYRLESIQIGTNRAYNSSINAVQESRIVSAILSSPSGTNLTLVQGEPLAWPGWTARLVSLDSALGWAVREADAFACADATARVVSVTATSVTISARSAGLAAQPNQTAVPLLTEPERTALAQRWAENAKRRQAALAAAAQPPEPDDQQGQPFAPVAQPTPPPRQVITVASQPQSAFGTVYSYPTEYTVIPAVWDMSGHLISERVVLPRHFEAGYAPFDSMPVPQPIVPPSTFERRPADPRARHAKDLKTDP